jgi:hypothetical protein
MSGRNVNNIDLTPLSGKPWNVFAMAAGLKVAQLVGAAILGSYAAGVSSSTQVWVARLAVPVAIANSAEVFGGGAVASLLVKSTAGTILLAGAGYTVHKFGGMANQLVYGVAGVKMFGNMGLSVGY